MTISARTASGGIGDRDCTAPPVGFDDIASPGRSPIGPAPVGTPRQAPGAGTMREGHPMDATTRDTSIDPVGAIAEEVLEHLRRGERPGAEEYVERHPGLADELRSLFPALLLMEQLGGGEAETTSRVRGPVGSGRHAGRPGGGPDGGVEQRKHYRIVGELGRGGMGVVFEARQESLGRRVALKQLPSDKRAEPHRLIRFLREAELNGQLEHPGIVPVYGLGGDGTAGLLRHAVHPRG